MSSESLDLTNKIAVYDPLQGFRLEVHKDENGCLVSNKFGPADFGHKGSLCADIRWIDKAAVALRTAFTRQFPYAPLVTVCNELQPNGELLIFVRTLRPYTLPLDAPVAKAELEEPPIDV
jgi:hypothetical protein